MILFDDPLPDFDGKSSIHEINLVARIKEFASQIYSHDLQIVEQNISP